MEKEINTCIDTEMPIDVHIKGNTYINYRIVHTYIHVRAYVHSQGNICTQYTNIHMYTRRYIHAKSNKREVIHTCNTLLYIHKQGQK